MLEKKLERKKYEAKVKEEQYLAVDPDNRLVASTLEKNWDEALQAVKVASSELKDHELRYCNVYQSLREFVS